MLASIHVNGWIQWDDSLCANEMYTAVCVRACVCVCLCVHPRAQVRAW